MARPVGTPTWIDCSADGLEQSLAFYERLVGWTYEDTGEETGHYRLASTPAGEVAGLMDTTGMTCPKGEEIPPRWDVYLAVDSVDETIAAARRAGGDVAVGPQDIPGRGRIAVILDATGCPVGLWEDGGFAGFPDSQATGSPVWFEIMSMDVEATRRFYTDVLGFSYVAMPGSDGHEGPGYFTNGPAESAASGLCDASSWFPAGTTSQWRWYLAVESMDDALGVVRELGGKVLDGPVDSPFGRVTTIEDPAGAGLQILEPPAGADDEGAR